MLKNRLPHLSEASFVPVCVLTASCVSGSVSLAYEIVWVKLLATVFGSSVTAAAAVTSLYMGGLAIGSLLYDRLISTRVTARHTVYAVLQFCTGAAAFVSFFLFFLLLNPASSRALPFTPAVYAIAAFCVFLPVVFTGALFPCAADILTRHGQPSSHRYLALLYASETGGGVAGVVITAWILLGTAGIRMSVLICVSVNVLLGCAFLFLRPGSDPPPKTTAPSAAWRGILNPLVFAFAQGTAVFIYEIAWIRILSLYVYSNIYGFAVILSGFLTGIIAGSLCASLLLTPDNHMKLFRASQILLALTASLFVPALRYVHTATRSLENPGIMIAASAVLTAVPLFFSGMAFASLLAHVQKKCAPSGTAGSGAVYGFNTAGAITGSCVAAFLLIPCAGAAYAVGFGALINLGLFAAVFRKRRFIRTTVSAAAGSFIVISVLFGSSRLVPPAVEDILDNGGTLLFSRETRGGTVTVARASRPENLKVCFVDNNSVICNIYDNLKTVGLLGHIPFLIKPQASRCMIVGFGTGVTARSVLSHPVDRAVCAEICEGVIECAPLFKELNTGVLNDPRLDLRIDDGRHVIMTSELPFDAVICDPVHPKLGSNSLYTKEFYILCRKKLTEDGVFIQYIPFHFLDSGTFRTLLRTFHSVYPNCSFWFGASHGILAGINGSARPCLDSLSALFIAEDIQKDLKLSGITNRETLIGAFVCGGDTVGSIAGKGPLNSDYFPCVEVSGITRGWKLQAENMRIIARHAEPADAFFRITDPALSASAANYARSVYYKISARAFQIGEDFASALRYLSTARSLNPLDAEIGVFGYEIERGEDWSDGVME